ncbi:MAG: enoyl-CoA hydratase/isomerase family protein [Microbacteriaceae bacterium]|nr:enoyl-CoA hydratase/isomerase family protein [Microbacteriaceae bacterium]
MRAPAAPERPTPVRTNGLPGLASSGSTWSRNQPSVAAVSDVVITPRGSLGHVLLNRPQAINALTHEMVVEIAAALAAWATDDSVETVAISGAGERGLCAGGDVTAMYRSAVAEGAAAGVDAAAFWADEYALNSTVAHYPKPYVALMTGVVLGGGVGVSAHGSHRVVTETTKLGMPEVTIGFVPDVGGTRLLARAPGELGTHLALTGGTMTGADAIALGFADWCVPSVALPALLDDLERMPAADAIARHAAAVPASDLLTQRAWVDEAYAGDDPVVIVGRLENSGVAEARAAASVIRSKSPTSVAVALEALRRAARLNTLEEVLDQEYRVGLRMLAGADMREGIRAQVIDKDRTPHWRPPTLEQVDHADVLHYFEPLGERELGLATRPA